MSRASALLQKVNTQLRGERVPIQSKEEDELTKYLSNLANKTGTQAKSVNFEDYGENISISSDSNLQKTPRKRSQSPKVGSIGSRFLKKKTPNADSQNVTPVASPRGPRRGYRAATEVPSTTPAKSTTKSTQSAQKTSALDKAKALTTKINDRGNMNKKSLFEVDTDDSVSLANFMHTGSADQLKSASEKSIGRDGNRFLKKTAAEKPYEEVTQKIEQPRPSTPSKGKRRPIAEKDPSKPTTLTNVPEYAHKGQKKYVQTVHLTSEEESLAEFMNRQLSADEQRSRNKSTRKQGSKGRDLQSPDLSFKRTPSPPSRTPKRTPSPIYRNRLSRSPSQDSDNVDSIRSEVADTPTDSSGNIFNTMNLMDLDSLEPLAVSPEPAKKKTKSSKKKKEKEKKSKTKSSKPSTSIFKASGASDTFKPKSSSSKKEAKKSDSFLNNFGLHTVDELLGGSDVPPESVISEASEIVTEKSDVFAAKKRKDSVSSIASEIVPDVEPQYSESFEESMISERIGQDSIQGTKQVHWSMDSEVKTQYSDATDYEEDFESVSHPETGTQTYQSDTEGYTSDTETYTRSYTDSRRPRSGPSQRPETCDVEIQTSSGPGLGYNWNMLSSGLAISGPGLGLGFVDPTPIASHVVSADALEAMTSYSPCMLALQDLLQQQLTLTRNFLSTQRRIYEASTATLEESYKYTTLEGTKEYIRKHRKPRLTFKQALKMVSRDMDR